MLSNLFLIIRAIILTVLVMFVLQLRVGNDTTLEQKTEAWIKHSPMISYLQEVADGGLIVLGQLRDYTAGLLDKKTKETFKASSKKVKSRLDSLKIERSSKYIKEKTHEITKEAKAVVKENIEDIHEDYLAEEYGIEEE